jgi:hypothetical protein
MSTSKQNYSQSPTDDESSNERPPRTPQMTTPPISGPSTPPSTHPRPQIRRPHWAAAIDTFYETHDFETALRNTIPTQPSKPYSLNDKSRKRARPSTPESQTKRRLLSKMEFTIHSDEHTKDSQQQVQSTPSPLRPLATIYLDSHDGLSPIRPGRRLTLVQEEARWHARRAQAAAEVLEDDENDNDDRDWNKENMPPVENNFTEDENLDDRNGSNAWWNTI